MAFAHRANEPPPPYTNQLETLRLPSLYPPEHGRDPDSRSGAAGLAVQNQSSPCLPTLEPRLVGSPVHLDNPSHPLDSHQHHHRQSSLSGNRAERESFILPHIQQQAAPTAATMSPLERQLPSLTSKSLTSISTPTDAVSILTLDDTASFTSSKSLRHDTSVSLEDPDDRMAAEALCGLGKIEPPRQVSGNDTPLKFYQGIEHTRPGGNAHEPEPLLSLLTSSHPWLGGTINGSISAYSTTKLHSPRFIQYGAEFVERNLSPVATTVGSVGKRTGVEGSLRRYLGRRTSELESAEREDAASKRRKLDAETIPESMDYETTPPLSAIRRSSTRSSVESLPPYDENRSPAYDEHHISSPTPTNSTQQLAFRSSSHTRSWSTQLMISTSGLGAALNDASLKSLKHCLIVLRTANGHVRRLMDALKKLLRFRDESPQAREEAATGDAEMQDVDDEETETVATRIQRLNQEIWNTLKQVVNKVSQYTGGALPENASMVVRWQLMSVPQRWQRAVSRSGAAPSSPTNGPSSTSASAATSSDEEAVSSAHRMMAFAVEGLDMMDQVGGVIDSTIVSAEKWLDSMGRKRNGDSTAQASSSARPGSGSAANGLPQGVSYTQSHGPHLHSEFFR